MSGKSNAHHLPTSRVKIMWHNLNHLWKEHKGARGLHSLGFFEQIINPFFLVDSWMKASKEATHNRRLLAEFEEFAKNQDLEKIKYVFSNSSFAHHFTKDTEKLLLSYLRKLQQDPSKHQERQLVEQFLTLRGKLLTLGKRTEMSFALMLSNKKDKEAYERHENNYHSSLKEFQTTYNQFLYFMLKHDNDLKKIFQDLENQQKPKKP